MKRIIPVENMTLFASAMKDTFEKQTEPLSPTLTFLGCLHGYLYLCKELNVPQSKYQIIKEALQEISEWYIMDMDIEAFATKSTSTITNETKAD